MECLPSQPQPLTDVHPRRRKTATIVHKRALSDMLQKYNWSDLWISPECPHVSATGCKQSWGARRHLGLVMARLAKIRFNLEKGSRAHMSKDTTRWRENFIVAVIAPNWSDRMSTFTKDFSGLLHLGTQRHFSHTHHQYVWQMSTFKFVSWSCHKFLKYLYRYMLKRQTHTADHRNQILILLSTSSHILNYGVKREPFKHFKCTLLLKIYTRKLWPCVKVKCKNTREENISESIIKEARGVGFIPRSYPLNVVWGFWCLDQRDEIKTNI